MMWNHPARFGSALKSDESVQTRAREDDIRVKSRFNDTISRFYFYFPNLDSNFYLISSPTLTSKFPQATLIQSSVWLLTKT
jgi:hypothetical protein